MQKPNESRKKIKRIQWIKKWEKKQNQKLDLWKDKKTQISNTKNKRHHLNNKFYKQPYAKLYKTDKLLKKRQTKQNKTKQCLLKKKSKIWTALYLLKEFNPLLKTSYKQNFRSKYFHWILLKFKKCYQFYTNFSRK